MFWQGRGGGAPETPGEAGDQELQDTYVRKNLTIFFSDIVQFTDLSDTLEPEKLAMVMNSYLSEMTTVALDCGGTIDKFIGDAIVVFFGDPDQNDQAVEDAKFLLESVVSVLRYSTA